jgi:hypothetical protein
MLRLLRQASSPVGSANACPMRLSPNFSKTRLTTRTRLSRCRATVACEKSGCPAPSVAWGSGARLIYVHIQEVDQIHLVTVYGKDQKDDLSVDDNRLAVN